jgi:hypothetical protein
MSGTAETHFLKEKERARGDSTFYYSEATFFK